MQNRLAFTKTLDKIFTKGYNVRSGLEKAAKYFRRKMKMKKVFAVMLALCMVLAIVVGCGKTTEAPKTDAPADNDLVALAKAEGELVVYGSCEEDYLRAACDNFEKLYDIKVTYQRLSTGEVQSKIEEENGNPSADVWFGGTTDPYNVVAAEGLLEPYAAQNASHLLNKQYRDPDGNWYGIYKGILGFMVNTDELARRIGRTCSSRSIRT